MRLILFVLATTLKLNFQSTRKFSLLLFCFTTGLTGAQDLVLTGGNLVDVTAGIIMQNPGILIRSGKIFQIGSVSVDNSATVVQLSNDDYLLPGLIDLHAHYRVVYQGKAKDDTTAMPKIFLANGVTCTFPAGEVEPYKMKNLKERIDRGEMPGPRILNSGPYFGTAAPDWDQGFSVGDIRQRVDRWAALGAKGFKAKGISRPQLQVLIERAHQHGLTVTAHLNSGVGGSVNPKEAIEMGIDRVEHFLGGELLPDSVDAYLSLAALDPTDVRLDQIVNQYIEQGVYFNATLATYGAIGQLKGPAFEMWIDENQFLTPFARNTINTSVQSDFSKLCAKIYPVKVVIIKRFYDAGGLITIGSDRPLLMENNLGWGLGGFFIHREMEAMVAAGIPASQVLKFATIQNAGAIGIADKLGSIEIGKWADIAIVKGNPIEDIRNTRSVYKVIKGGKLFDSHVLLKSCIDRLGPTSHQQWLGN